MDENSRNWKENSEHEHHYRAQCGDEQVASNKHDNQTDKWVILLDIRNESLVLGQIIIASKQHTDADHSQKHLCGMHYSNNEENNDSHQEIVGLVVNQVSLDTSGPFVQIGEIGNLKSCRIQKKIVQ